MVVTLDVLRSRVRQRVDMETVYSDLVLDPELNIYIQKSWEALYNRMVGAYEDYFVKIVDETGLTEPVGGGNALVAGFKDYWLPVDYFKLKKIELLYGTEYQMLDRINWLEENRYRGSSNSRPLAYILYGSPDAGGGSGASASRIRLVPTPDKAYSVNLVYIPIASTIPEPEAVGVGVDFVNGWDEWVVLDACIKCADKEQRNTKVLETERERMWVDTILPVIAPRDAGQPPRATSPVGIYDDEGELMLYE